MYIQGLGEHARARAVGRTYLHTYICMLRTYIKRFACVYVYMYVCVYIHRESGSRALASAAGRTYIHTHTYICAGVCVYIGGWRAVHASAVGRTYIRTYIQIYIYTYIYTFKKNTYIHT